MVEKKKKGLGKGLGALIPNKGTSVINTHDRPIDVFFAGEKESSKNKETVGSNSSDRLLKAENSGNDAVAETNKTSVKESTSQYANNEKNGESKTGEPSAASKKRKGRISVPANVMDSTRPKGLRQGVSKVRKADFSALTQAVVDAGNDVNDDFVENEENSSDLPTEVLSESPAKTLEPVSTINSAANSDHSVALATSTVEEEKLTSPINTEDIVPVPGAEYAEIPIDLLTPNLQQPRSVFDEDDLNEIATSIREVGVLQPVVVRKITADKENEARRRRDATLEFEMELGAPEVELAEISAPKFEIVMGERRWRASRRAGLTEIPAIIRTTEDSDLLRDALLENLHRANLNPLEEAAAYNQLMEDFNCTQEQLSKRIARSRPQISNTLRLIKIPVLVQRRVAAGVISAGHARALLGLASGAEMEQVAQRIVAEGLSVRNVEEIVALMQVSGGIESKKSRGQDRLGGATGSSRETSAGNNPGSGALYQLAEQAAIVKEHTDELKDWLDTTVNIKVGKRSGKIVIGFADLEDINRVMRLLQAGDRAALLANEPERG